MFQVLLKTPEHSCSLLLLAGTLGASEIREDAQVSRVILFWTQACGLLWWTGSVSDSKGDTAKVCQRIVGKLEIMSVMIISSGHNTRSKEIT